jgi:hypothetical protein
MFFTRHSIVSLDRKKKIELFEFDSQVYQATTKGLFTTQGLKRHPMHIREMTPPKRLFKMPLSTTENVALRLRLGPLGRQCRDLEASRIDL